MFHSLRGGQGLQTSRKHACFRNGFAMTRRPQIVDSIMALFRADYSGRGELSERQQKVCQYDSSITRFIILTSTSTQLAQAGLATLRRS